MTLIARTLEKESLAEDGVFWWKEYRLSKSVWGEFQVELRYLCRIEEKTYARINGGVALFTNPDNIWEVWSKGDSPEEAIRYVIGDSDFFNAVSIDYLHSREVERVRDRILVNGRRRLLEENYRRANESYLNWKKEQQDLFYKRHGDKTGQDFEKAFHRTKKRLQSEHDRLLSERNEAKLALDNFQTKEEECPST